MENSENLSENNQNNQLNNLALIETHLQVSNLVKILFTVNYELLKALVEQTPNELKQTSHYLVLESALDFYSKMIELNRENEETKDGPETEEPSNIIVPDRFS